MFIEDLVGEFVCVVEVGKIGSIGLFEMLVEMLCWVVVVYFIVVM